jgi:hypothetical protein
MARVVERLRDADPQIRHAALAALPRTLDVSVRGEVARLARDGGTMHAELTLALGRCWDEPLVEDLLLDALRQGDAQLRPTALRTLAGKPLPLTAPEPVIAVALDRTRTRAERGLALVCLERTRTLESVPELLAMQGEDDVLDYLLGRLAVTGGHASAPDAMASVLDGAATRLSREDGALGRAVTDDCRWILAHAPDGRAQPGSMQGLVLHDPPAAVLEALSP